MVEINQVYKEAIEHFGAARYGEAERLCGQILSQHPEHAEAIHLLGLMAHRQGDLQGALERLTSAVQLVPHQTVYLNSLGMVLFALERTSEAIEILERAVGFSPNWPDPYNNLGVALNHADRYSDALVHFLMALRYRPDDPEICNNIGITLYGLQRYGEAVEYHTRALAGEPDFAAAVFHRGRAHAALGHYQEALADYQHAIELAGDWPDAYNGIGMVQAQQVEFDKAMEAYGKAIELDAEFFQAYYNRANVFVLLGRYDEAVSDFTKAIQLHPDFADAYWNRGLCFLLKGEYAKGWADYVQRKDAVMNLPTYPHALEGPEWDGGSFAGQRLLVHYEQGFGDSIQCWRFLPQVKALGGTVVVEEQKPLVELVETFACVDEVILFNHDQPPQRVHNLHVSLMDLPRIFCAEPDTVGGLVPYVQAPKGSAEKWAGRIDQERFSIGIAWAGSPLHKNNENRSCRLNYFLPLGRIEGVQLYSLQKRPGIEELSAAASACEIADLGSEFEDFADTAGVMEHLDLVIAVDTAVLHLAGAMGKRAWGLLPFAPDWRWMRDCETSPWYPTIRLFRQRNWGDWNEVFLRVIDEVKKTLQRSRF